MYVYVFSYEGVMKIRIDKNVYQYNVAGKNCFSSKNLEFERKISYILYDF